MKAWVAITDRDWFRYLRERPRLDEANFWQPGGAREFRTLSVGQPLLLKLHYPDHFIVGGGFFRHATRLPASLAWEAFGDKNGAASFEEMRRRIERYRRVPADPRIDYTIGCILLQEPFFFEDSEWIPAPLDFHRNIVQGKTYDLTDGIGKALWDQVLVRLRHQGRADGELGSIEQPMFREGVSVRQRLGQGCFRVLIADIYQRRCAVTGEKALPVLQAAHIRPVTAGGTHQIDNGLLLRSDVHTLFDRGYVTVTRDYKLRVSRRLRDDFDNGENYFRLNKASLWMPPDPADRPSTELLEWHADTVFKG
ncbi:MAG TPA: HNH endonuclease signature motif containing protein [Candidatus Polarisedimenticolia bacterium]|jgi:putative restriction endonuclease|nr:HNH endonuclease signature motif containing protein [Candidatus Polarisedimenticolia bacterium]